MCVCGETHTECETTSDDLNETNTEMKSWEGVRKTYNTLQCWVVFHTSIKMLINSQ